MAKKVMPPTEKTTSTRRIGIFSGTFDPVHDGHIAFALKSIENCSLEHVIFLPERSPRGKTNVADFEQRVEQLGTALRDYQNLSVQTLNQDRFSVAETLPKLRQLFGNAHLTLLIGSDIVRGSLAQWPHIDELIENVSFAIGLRKDDAAEDMEKIIKQIQDKTKKPIQLAYIKTDFPHLSSSQLRVQ